VITSFSSLPFIRIQRFKSNVLRSLKVTSSSAPRPLLLLLMLLLFSLLASSPFSNIATFSFSGGPG